MSDEQQRPVRCYDIVCKIKHMLKEIQGNMKSTGIFYGPETGTTKDVAHRIGEWTDGLKAFL